MDHSSVAFLFWRLSTEQFAHWTLPHLTSLYATEEVKAAQKHSTWGARFAGCGF